MSCRGKWMFLCPREKFFRPIVSMVQHWCFPATNTYHPNINFMLVGRSSFSLRSAIAWWVFSVVHPYTSRHRRFKPKGIATAEVTTFYQWPDLPCKSKHHQFRLTNIYAHSKDLQRTIKSTPKWPSAANSWFKAGIVFLIFLSYSSLCSESGTLCSTEYCYLRLIWALANCLATTHYAHNKCYWTTLIAPGEGIE